MSSPEIQASRPGAGRSRGFTIVELLIATLVFSIVLLIVTTGILQITRVYLKGVTETTTQNTARAMMDTISQAIQFGGGAVVETVSGPVAGTDYAFCVGSQQFTYRLGWQVENGLNPAKHQAWHGLVEKTGGGCTAQILSNQVVVGRDLIGPHMRLSNLVVQNIGTNTYRIQVRVVYGDDDLLFDPLAPANPTGYTSKTASCRNINAGTQFCAESDLSTVVVKRVE